MKVSNLKKYLSQWINNIRHAERELIEEGLGFDAMLSHEVVHFLLTDHSMVYPVKQKIMSKADSIFALDEYELAMVW